MGTFCPERHTWPYTATAKHHFFAPSSARWPYLVTSRSYFCLSYPSLPIKGREARPGRERGNHGRTPPNRLVVTPIMASRSEKRSRGRADRIGSSRLVVHEDPAPAIAKQGLSRGALDDGDAEESERSDAIARGGVLQFFLNKSPHSSVPSAPHIPRKHVQD